MICRDRDTNTESEGFETREYVLQNWRADVVALAAPDGDLLERVSYDPYGIPFGTWPTDLTSGATGGVTGYGTPNGTVNNDDYTYFLALYSGSSPRADWNRDGSLTAADNTAFLADHGAASGSWGRGVLSNRQNILGYAGYVHEPATGSAGGGHGTMYHCRLRVHHAGLGRWIQRDPPRFEYGEGMSLYWYGAASPVLMLDWLGGPACPGAGPGGYCNDPAEPEPPATPIPFITPKPPPWIFEPNPTISPEYWCHDQCTGPYSHAEAFVTCFDGQRIVCDCTSLRPLRPNEPEDYRRARNSCILDHELANAASAMCLPGQFGRPGIGYLPSFPVDPINYQCELFRAGICNEAGAYAILQTCLDERHDCGPEQRSWCRFYQCEDVALYRCRKQAAQMACQKANSGVPCEEVRASYESAFSACEHSSTFEACEEFRPE